MIYEKEKWSLEIHHIDVGGGKASPGDATLIVVKYGDDIKRTALIDGGNMSNSSGFPVLDYLKTTLINYGKVDVMVNTHYDQDHLEGLKGLLISTLTTDRKKRPRGYPKYPCSYFEKSRIFDIGLNLALKSSSAFNTHYPHYIQAIHGLRKGSLSFKINSIVNTNFEEVSAKSGPEDGNYRELRNVKEIDSKMKDKYREHVTQYVSDSGEMEGRKNLGWLLGKEILWSTGTSKEDTFKDGTESEAVKSGAPTVTCVAVNQKIISKFTLDEIDPTPMDFATPSAPERDTTDADKLTATLENEVSMALIIRFNNFRYYVGGDLPTGMEDQLAKRLNPDNGFKNRIIAMKTSHHGAAESTSADFVERLKPSGVFISCGVNNKHRHPHYPVITRLLQAKFGLSAKLDQCYLTGFYNPSLKGKPENHVISQAQLEFDKLKDKSKYDNDFNVYVNRAYKPVEIAGVYLWHNPNPPEKWEPVSDDAKIKGDVVLYVSSANSMEDGTPKKDAKAEVFTVKCTFHYDWDSFKYEEIKGEEASITSRFFTHKI